MVVAELFTNENEACTVTTSTGLSTDCRQKFLCAMASFVMFFEITEACPCFAEIATFSFNTTVGCFEWIGDLAAFLSCFTFETNESFNE